MEFFSISSEKQRSEEKEKSQQVNAMIINLVDLNPNILVIPTNENELKSFNSGSQIFRVDRKRKPNYNYFQQTQFEDKGTAG